mgnify:CR=1 FL=1
MKLYLWIALGSALGGVARHAAGTFAAARYPGLFPWGTLAVNLLGSFAIGVAAAWPEGRIDATTRMFLTAGVLGGFTTFSAFSLQTAQLFTGGHAAAAAIYMAGSALACPLLAWAGWRVAQNL